MKLSRKRIYTLLIDFALTRLSQDRRRYKDSKKVDMKTRYVQS